MGLRKALVLVSFTIALTSSFPRRELVNSWVPIGPSSRLSSSIEDYWSQRGFHDTLTDHMLASDSQPKAYVSEDAEIITGRNKIRIPKDMLTPPMPYRTIQMKRKRTRPDSLTPAQRKQDLEIMESVILVDGGTQMPDGSIKIRQSNQKPQRKYNGVNDQISPLSYRFPEDYKPYQQPQQQQQREVFHTLPYYEKPVQKAPKAVQSFPKAQSLSHFQKQLLQSEIPQQYQFQKYFEPTQPPTLAPKPKTTIFVIPPPKPQPSTIPQPQQEYPTQSLKAQEQVAYKSQAFQQQFQHPIPQSSVPQTLAKFTASLLQTASGAAGVAAAAASALAGQAEVASSFLQSVSASPQSRTPSLVSSAAASSSLPISVPNPISASSQASPQFILSDSSDSPFQPTSLRPGTVSDEEIIQNQLIEPESMAKKLTRIYETGRKILYFPKGVVDTVDTLLKQMERNPMVAYWGDKFFAKVFGDTSGT